MTRSTHRRTVPVAAGALAVAGLATALGLAAPAAFAASTSGTTTTTSHPACTAADVSAVRQQVDGDLAARVTELGVLTGAVQSAGGLTTSDRSTLSATLSTTTAGIDALVQKVPTDTTCLQLWQDAGSMVRTYRVFAVVAPQTHLDIAADTANGIEATLVGDEPGIQAAIAAAGRDGVNVTDAQSSFADLQSRVTAAQAATSGVPAAVLAQTPAGYPGNASVFVAARNSVNAAYGDLQTAAADLQAVVADLR